MRNAARNYLLYEHYELPYVGANNEVITYCKLPVDTDVPFGDQITPWRIASVVQAGR